MFLKINEIVIGDYCEGRRNKKQNLSRNDFRRALDLYNKNVT